MKQRRLLTVIGGIVLLVVLVVAAGFAYIYVTAGSGKPSAPISAPAVVENNNNSSGQAEHFQIDPSKSKVTFTLSEVLLGNPNTVVGATNQVAGDILVNLDNPASSQIGTIRIDARTFATDSSMRDRMIRGPILGSSQDEFEYIDFAPTGLSGLPDKIAPGQTYTFQVAGTMTVHGATKPVTFTVTAQLASGSPDQLTGSATATVHRADFNLQIPHVPSVASVSDDVKLEIDFVALQSNGSAATQPATQSPSSGT